MIRRLALKPERLSELTTDELDGVVAGGTTAGTKECPDYTYYCVTGDAICSRRVCV